MEVVAGGRVIDRFLELEVELKAGDEAGLADLAAILGADAALEPITTSKLERALGGPRAGRAAGAVARGRRRGTIVAAVGG